MNIHQRNGVLRAAVFAAAAMLLTLQFSAAANANPLAFARKSIQNCSGDIARLCDGVFPGGGRIAQCLMDQYEDLTPRCRKSVVQANSASNFLFACEADTRRYCYDVIPGGGRIVNCLGDNRRKLSRTCRRAMDRAKSVFKH